MINWQDRVSKWDIEIKSGNLESVRHDLRAMPIKSVPRPYLQAVAKTARRVQYFSFSLKLLYNIVRKDQDALAPEIIEYAASLLRIGSTREALDLLSQLKASEFNEVYLISAYAEIAQWNYGDAATLLRSYLLAPNLDEYASLVAKTNLTAALVFCHQLDEARELAEQLIPESQIKGLNLVLIQSWIHLIQIHLDSHNLT